MPGGSGSGRPVRGGSRANVLPRGEWSMLGQSSPLTGVNTSARLVRTSVCVCVCVRV